MPVNGIKLAAGQKWKTKNYGVVTLSESGVNSNYPWRMNFPNNGDPIGSITTDGKYWDEDETPELLECIYNPEDKEEKKPMNFDPQPGDKIICNNGEEFICCTLGFLQENIAKFISSNKPILGYWKYKHNNTWQDWDEHGNASYDNDNDYDIREVIPQSSEVTDDKKEEVKEEPRYTVEEVFQAAADVWDVKPWSSKSIQEVKEHLSKINDPQYLEFLRLKEIYEPN